MQNRSESLWTLTALSACLLALAFAGCDKATDGGGGSGLSAKVDGEAWEAEPIGVTAQAIPSSPGCIAFSGAQSKGAISSSITVTLYNVKDTGIYPLGTGSEVIGGMGQAGQSTGEGGGKSNAWITEGTGLDGEVHVTKFTSSHITATFHYVCVPGKNNPLTVNKVITDGKVDMDYKGTLLPVLEKHGSKVRATLGGKPYNAATINASLVDLNGNAGVNISTLSSVHGISIMLSGVTAKGVYTGIHMQPNPRSVGAGRNSALAEQCCWGGDGDTVTIEVTDISAARVKGTFHGVLVPRKPATTSLEIKDGIFDVGIP